MIGAVYCGKTPIDKIYFANEVIFQADMVEPFDFHVRDEEGRLIIVGALSTNSLPSGLYIDCVPDWEFPVQDGNVLTITQVHKATKNGDILEVE